MWHTEPGADAFSFTGKHYRVEANHNAAPPAQRPYPPIIIGAPGRSARPAIAARFADEFNGALSDDLRECYARFDRACERIGRDPDAVATRPSPGGLCHDAGRGDPAGRGDRVGAHPCHAAIGSPALVADRVEDLRKAGADTIYFHIFDIEDLDHVALLGAAGARWEPT